MLRWSLRSPAASWSLHRLQQDDWLASFPQRQLELLPVGFLARQPFPGGCRFPSRHRSAAFGGQSTQLQPRHFVLRHLYQSSYVNSTSLVKDLDLSSCHRIFAYSQSRLATGAVELLVLLLASLRSLFLYPSHHNQHHSTGLEVHLLAWLAWRWIRLIFCSRWLVPGPLCSLESRRRYPVCLDTLTL